jgi:CDP-diacylglycerol--glycerol-3-phosphate 3-phosphatidyltransferase
LDQQKMMNNLRKEWGATFAAGLLFLAALAALLSTRWAPAHAATWLPLPLAALIYLFVVCWRGLGDNRRNGETALLAGFGWGNRLTLLRGILIAAMLGFIVIPRPPGWLAWIPGVLYTLACAADFFDGYVARVTNHATRLGEILDLSFDGVGVLAAVLLAVLYGQVPAWYLAIGAARYLFLGGIWLRQRLGLPVYELPPRLDRRVFAGLQMGFLAGVLWPVFTPPGTHIAAALFGLPLFFGFTRDWLHVSGMIDARAEAFSGVSGVVQRWLPVGLRALILALNLGLLIPWLEDAASLGLIPIAVGVMNLVAAAMLVLGVMPRVFAIVALCGLGFSQVFGPLTSPQIVLAVLYTTILYIGSGALSLWTPEDYLYSHHAGERKKLGAESRP